MSNPEFLNMFKLCFSAISSKTKDGIKYINQLKFLHDDPLASVTPSLIN